jgi:glyoxylase-like metal-dependent hydrolase (beta-lactamase superfamily II)
MSSSVPEVRVISIGALAAHPMRGERAPVRTGHSTTTLITAGDARILVDPGLPGPAIVARLEERAGLSRDAQAAGEELDEDQETMLRVLKRDVAILQRTQAAPDSLAPGVDLFPLPGLTPGLTGLLVLRPSGDILICADAIPTVEHLEQGKVLQSAADVDQARESFQEAIEIADLLVLGRDNMVVNPTKRPF